MVPKDGISCLSLEFLKRLDGNPTVECNSLGPAVFPVTFLIPTLNRLGTRELEEVSHAVIVQASILFDLLNKVQIPPCLTLVFLATHLFVKKTLRRHTIKTRLSEGSKNTSWENQWWDNWAWKMIDFMCKAVVKCSVAFWGHAIANK